MEENGLEINVKVSEEYKNLYDSAIKYENERQKIFHDSIQSLIKKLWTEIEIVEDKKEPITIYFSKEEMIALEIMSIEEDRSIAEIIKDRMKCWINRWE